MPNKGRFIFYNIAFVLWGVAFIVHVLSVMGIAVQEYVPFVFVLHGGVFLVFFPAIIFSIIDRGGFDLDNKITRRERARENRRAMFQLFKTVPKWLSVSVIIAFIYAMLNFFLFMSSQPGGPEIKEGQYVLQNHGTIIKELTKEEYLFYLSNELRGFSGHWLLFYGAAALMLYPNKKTDNIK